MSSNRNNKMGKKRISLFETSNPEELPVSQPFNLEIDYPMMCAVEHELKQYAEKTDANFSLTINRSSLTVQINVVSPAQFASADKSFRSVLSLLNTYRLTTRDREEFLGKYEEFLKDNNLHEFMRSHSRHGHTDSFNSSGRNNFAY